jgi:predicted membrane protein
MFHLWINVFITILRYIFSPQAAAGHNIIRSFVSIDLRLFFFFFFLLFLILLLLYWWYIIITIKRKKEKKKLNQTNQRPDQRFSRISPKNKKKNKNKRDFGFCSATISHHHHKRQLNFNFFSYRISTRGHCCSIMKQNIRNNSLLKSSIVQCWIFI